jgi:methylated-DNA-[protein]-cysteine S-methyltransferase
MRYTYLDSPLGALLAVRDEAGLTGLYLPSGRHPVKVAPEWVPGDTAFDDVRGQFDEYFSGQRQTFDLRLHLSGTAFQKRVWTALLDIPYGETTSYGKTAAAIGAPRASRAVGLANGQNPVAIIVPCHRVVGANGSLTGYGGGLDAKRWLLEHELTHCGATLPL